MPLTRSKSNKRPSDSADSTQSNKRPKQHHSTLLEGVDITAPRLGTKMWATISAFIECGSTVEDETRRWQHMLENMYHIGKSRKEEHGNINGSISSRALKDCQSAFTTPPYKENRQRLAATKTSDIPDDPDTEAEESDPSTPPRQSDNAQAPPTPPETGSKAARTGTSSGKPTSSWSTSWVLITRTFEKTSWLNGMTKVLTHMFTRTCVDNMVNIADDLYNNRDVIALNNATKTKVQLNNTEDELIRSVVVRYKTLWDAMENCALSDCKVLLAYYELGMALGNLELQLDQIDNVPVEQLSGVAREYLESRNEEGRRLSDTDKTRAIFLGGYLLKVLGYGKSSQRSAKDLERKARSVKSQRMTAKNVKAMVDIFGQGSLLLMCKTVWASALDQVSEKTLKPLLQQLAAKEPELGKAAELAGKVLEYATNKVSIATMPRVVIRAQELSVKARGRLSLTELLGPPEAELQVAGMFEDEHGAARNSDDEENS